MPTLGQINMLNVIEKVADGLYLDGAELEEIFLPVWDSPDDVKEGDSLDVFLYLDVQYYCGNHLLSLRLWLVNVLS